MKRRYIKPAIEKVALPAATMMTTLSVKGTESGEARASRYYGVFPWEEEEDSEDEDCL